MLHLSVTSGGPTEWLDKVSDAEYHRSHPAAGQTE
jgi:hypothetical protein